MEPFFFGKDREILGNYHRAEGIPKACGLLIAGPLLNEGIRAHRALLQVSRRCAALGYDVLRFDYAGLGNSPGATRDFSFDDWSQDIVDAATELTAVSGSEVKAVLAVRFAANLVADLTQSLPLDRLLLWDPILTGRQWLNRLHIADECLPVGRRANNDSNGYEYMGHVLGSDFEYSLLSRQQPQLRAASVFAVISSAYLWNEELDTLTNDIEIMNSDCGWESPTSDLIYPSDIIGALCRRMT